MWLCISRFFTLSHHLLKSSRVKSSHKWPNINPNNFETLKMDPCILSFIVYMPHTMRPGCLFPEQDATQRHWPPKMLRFTQFHYKYQNIFVAQFINFPQKHFFHILGPSNIYRAFIVSLFLGLWSFYFLEPNFHWFLLHWKSFLYLYVI